METAQRLISTRRGTILLSVIAAAVAGGLILVYVNRYRDSVKASGAPVTVLVAKVNINKGTAGDLIASSGLYSTTTLRQSQVLEGAFSDTSNLTGKVAATAIPQGAQLTAADFAPASSNLTASLTGKERVISLPFNSAQGLSGALQVGDHVDVYGGFNVSSVGPNGLASGGGSRPVVRRILTDVPVVAIGGSTTGAFASSNTNLSFKVTDQQAADLAFASQNGTLWLGLEPSAGLKSSRPSVVTMETLLLGVPPSTVLRSLGGRH
jgi:Flp pilus assembly protein CpaB